MTAWDFLNQNLDALMAFAFWMVVFFWVTR